MHSGLPLQSGYREATEGIDAFLAPIDSLLKGGNQGEAYQLLKVLQQWQGKRQWVEERLRSIYRQWIPRWHFEMLNDTKRGQAYADALAALDLKGKTVLDIGAGSGFLSMLAVRCGARHVYACEMVEPLAEMAVNIVRQNGMADKITIIPKSSFEIELGKEMPERAEVMLSETLDYGFIGEGFLSSLRHAKQNLLKPDALLVPCGMRLCGALVDSPNIHHLNHVDRSQGFDVSAMNEFSARSYFPVRLVTRPHRMLSEVKTLVDADLHGRVPEFIKQVTEFEVTQSGTVHGVAFWFEVTLAPGVVLSNGPDQPESHWTQAFITFCEPWMVQKGGHCSLEVALTEQAINIAPPRQHEHHSAA